jgi:hypothetical protein
MTITGLIIIPLGLLIILLPWRYSLLALPVLATMNSAAVVNVGSVGLQPGYFFGMLIIARTAIEIVVLLTPLNVHVIRWLTPLFLFTIICFISIWLGLTLFQGSIMVMGSEARFNLDLAQPYTFQRQNLTQPFYLVLNVAIVYAVAHQVARMPADRVTVTIDRAILSAISFASIIVIWEMAAFHSGLLFFSSFFHSNAAYAEAHGQVLFGEILRASGPFSEPSALAYSFSGFLMYAWYRYLRRPSTGAMGVFLLCIAVMAASTSTTAYLVLGIFALVVVKDVIVVLTTSGSRLRVSMQHVGAAALIGIAALGAFAFIRANWDDIDAVLTRMLLEKHQSSSFVQRSSADMMAVDIVMESGGIGIGLGSHRPSNLLMTLLSNTGIVGSLVYGIFLFELIRPRRSTRFEIDVRPYRWMAIGMLLVSFISSPGVNSLPLSISFALIIGALVPKRELAGNRPVSAWRMPVSTTGAAPIFRDR